MKRVTAILFVTLLLALSVSAVSAQDPAIDYLNGINSTLADRGLNIRASAIHYFTIGQGRDSARILQQPFRWVPNDSRRLGGSNLTYTVVPSGTSSGVSAADTTAAIDRSMSTWNSQQCLRKVSIDRLPYDGVSEITLFDDNFYNPPGDPNWQPTPTNPFYADIVNAGWHSPAFFGSVGASPDGTLAFSVTFTFINPDGSPSDINGDNYVDVALNEVYYNDAFGGTLRPRNPWGINAALPGIDIETVSLHENGHSLGHGHFGPPPDAVMNPIYAGMNHTPEATDNSAMCALYNRWPN